MNKTYQIKDILLDLVSVQSDTGTALEKAMGEKIISYFENDPYFSSHRDMWGYDRGKDIFQRPVVWALKKGKTNRTLILSGHYDAVEIGCYGKLQPYALNPEKLREEMLNFPLNHKGLEEDLQDSDWWVGRGMADMKAGVAIALYTVLTAEEPPVSILFTAVSDEENVSAGTLMSIPLYLKLKEKFQLDYRLTLISEPQFDKNPGFTVYNGGTGKILPIIMTKGRVSHAAQPMKGLNAVNMLAEIVRNIDLNPELTTEDLGLHTQLPIVQVMKDLKFTYDVSMPDFAAACVNVLFLGAGSPRRILKKIEEICLSSMEQVMKRYEEGYQYTLSAGLINPEEKPELSPVVMSLSQLEDHIRNKVYGDEKEYDRFRSELTLEIQARIERKDLTLQTGSIHYVQELIKASKITQPLVVVGMAPPYLPAVCNQYLDWDMKPVEAAIDFVLREHQLKLFYMPYFTGMGDISYMTCTNPSEERKLMESMCLPKEIYDIPFEDISKLDTPCIYLGPRCEDPHQWSERVYMPDVTHLVPEIINKIINTL